ncbi:MAG: substrate-binding domain-containing protein, partial [Chthonomonadales bacterium]
MRKGYSWYGLAGAALLAVTVTGCPKDNSAASAGSSPSVNNPNMVDGATTKSDIKIAVIPKGTAHSFWQTVKLGADAAGAEEKVEIIWQGPDKEGSITDQINLVQTQTTNKVSGIVLAATDSTALVKPLLEAKEKGIPVVTIDSGVTDKSASLCYIATDNVEGG